MLAFVGVTWMFLGDDTPSIEQCDTPKVAGRRNPVETNAMTIDSFLPVRKVCSKQR